MKYPTVEFLALSRTILAILISVFMLIGAISCSCETSGPQSQGVAWQLDRFKLEYEENYANLDKSDISPIVEPGQEVLIYAQIRNVGTEAGAYEWKVYLDNAIEPFYTKTTGNIVAGSSDWIGEPPHIYYIKTSSLVIGQHELKIGTVTRHFTVYHQTPAEISGVSADPPVTLLNETVALSGQVKNPGSNNEYYTLYLSVDNVFVKSQDYRVDARSTVVFTFFIAGWNFGTHSVLVTADHSSSQATGEFSVGGVYTLPPGVGIGISGWSAGTPLVLASVTLLDGVVGESYTTDDVKPTGGITPYSYSVTAGSLPAGLSIRGFDDHFRIEGTPTAFGVCDFDITVNNSGVTTGGVKATFKITVFPNLKGTWMMTTTVTQANGVCAGEGGTHSRQITVTQNGKSVTFSGFTGSQANQLTGEILPPGGSFIDVTNNNEVILNNSEKWLVYVTGSYPEDFGTTTSTRRLVIDTATTMSGVEDWNWVGGGGDCPGSKATVTATRISGP